MEALLRTINLGETGALRASEISWILALTLPFLDLIVLSASVKLFCLECPREPALDVCHHDELGDPVSLRDCQRSPAGGKKCSFCCVRLLLGSPSP